MRIAVQTPELFFLFDAAHADRIRTLDDLGLGPVAPLGFRVATFGFDSGKRVKRRYERDVEFVLEMVADDAAQPIVPVDDVGFLVGRDPLHHTVAELVRNLRQRLFWKVVRPGLDVHHTMTRLDEHFSWQALAIGTGECGALDADLAERRHKFTYIDVHPTAVTKARLKQRRGVERDHCDSKHHGFRPYRGEALTEMSCSESVPTRDGQNQPSRRLSTSASPSR